MTLAIVHTLHTIDTCVFPLYYSYWIIYTYPIPETPATETSPLVHAQPSVTDFTLYTQERTTLIWKYTNSIWSNGIEEDNYVLSNETKLEIINILKDLNLV